MKLPQFYLPVLLLLTRSFPLWAFENNLHPHETSKSFLARTKTSLFLTQTDSTAHQKQSRNRVVIVGGGIGGLASAFDARHLLHPNDEIVVVSDRPQFSFTPSNPWVAIRKRKPEDIQLSLAEILPRHDIKFVLGKAVKLQPESKQLRLQGGTVMDYDYLIIATGPRLAFEVVPGLKEAGFSVCTTPHSSHAAQALDQLVQNPGPVVVGATQGASCFGPAYEYALLLKHAMKKRGGKELLDKCPMTFVTSEPEIGHLGLNGAGESKCIMADLLKQHNIDAISNANTVKVTQDTVQVEPLDKNGKTLEKRTLPSKLTMLIPPFHGHNVWKNVPGLTDDHGMILVNDYQQSPKYPEIFGVGVCVGIPNQEHTPVPIGIPKTGYLIESQGTAAVKNIRNLIKWKQPSDKTNEPQLHSKPILNGLCITDFGDDGAIFLTMPQIPPRRHDFTLHSKAATLAKIAFEKYFLHKIESGDTDPYYEKYMLKLIGVERTQEVK